MTNAEKVAQGCQDGWLYSVIPEYLEDDLAITVGISDSLCNTKHIQESQIRIIDFVKQSQSSRCLHKGTVSFGVRCNPCRRISAIPTDEQETNVPGPRTLRQP